MTTNTRPAPRRCTTLADPLVTRRQPLTATARQHLRALHLANLKAGTK